MSTHAGVHSLDQQTPDQKYYHLVMEELGSVGKSVVGRTEASIYFDLPPTTSYFVNIKTNCSLWMNIYAGNSIDSEVPTMMQKL